MFKVSDWKKKTAKEKQKKDQNIRRCLEDSSFYFYFDTDYKKYLQFHVFSLSFL